MILGTIVRELRHGVRGRVGEAHPQTAGYWWVYSPEAPIGAGYLVHERDMRVVRVPRQNRKIPT